MQFLKSSTQEEKEITALNKYKLFILLLISSSDLYPLENLLNYHI